MSYAFKSIGLRPILALDVDSKAVRSYRTNVAKCGSVSDVRNVRVDIKADVIIAGPPCQGFSTLGRRDPKDIRNRLGLSVVKWAEAVNPKIVVIENVPTFVGTEWFEMITLSLASLGYELQTYTLDALNYGAAQRRARSFTIASRLGIPLVPPTRKSKPRTFRDVVLARPISPNDPMQIWSTPSALAKARYEAIPLRGGKKELMIVRPDLCPESWFGMHGEATDVWGRIDPDSPTNTLRCSFLNPSKGRYIHPYENRTLSLREGARLQGIPDKWVMYGEPTPIARQIGNGVPIPLGRAIGKQIFDALKCDEIGRYTAAA